MVTCTPTITEANGLWGGRHIHFKSIASTNGWALENPEQCGHGDLIVADDQTDGRGRLDRKWSSLPGKSITLSVVIDSSHLPSLAQEHYTQIAALAIRRLLSQLQVNAKLKWPNDVMTENGKICGILAEHIADTRIVVGIGINATIDPSEVDCNAPCTSIHAETKSMPESDAITLQLKDQLERAFTDCASTGMTDMRAEWKACDYLANKEITIKTPTGTVAGSYSGVNEDGQLLLNISGATQAFSAGDVTLSLEEPPVVA